MKTSVELNEAEKTNMKSKIETVIQNFNGELSFETDKTTNHWWVCGKDR